MRNRNRCYVLSIITVYSSSSHKSVCVCVCVVPYGFDGYLDRWQHVKNRKNNRPVEFPRGLLLQLESFIQVCSLAHFRFLHVILQRQGFAAEERRSAIFPPLPPFHYVVHRETHRGGHRLVASMQIRTQKRNPVSFRRRARCYIKAKDLVIIVQER